MQRDRLILREDYEQLHEGMRRLAAMLDWQVVDELPEDRSRLVTLESLGLREPTMPDELGPLDAEGLPTLDDETIEAPPVAELDEAPPQTAPMLTFGASGGTVADIDLYHHWPEDNARAPTLDEYVAAGYRAENYERFRAQFDELWGDDTRTDDEVHAAVVDAFEDLE